MNCYQHRTFFASLTENPDQTLTERVKYSLELPVTIPKSMFERELDYYGVAIKKDSITAETVTTFGESLMAEYRLAEEKRCAFLLAMESHRQFLMKQRDGVFEHVTVVMDCNNDLCYDLLNHSKRHPGAFNSDSPGRRIFDKYLGEFFGLEVLEVTKAFGLPSLLSGSFRVKKRET